ncbi:hypothetical protein [Sporomusa aerivorans]|uniref:hypothetical protein n=1 Tax=Sporomusa aerivorans TaxID=204936 RepID=UPI00352B0576
MNHFKWKKVENCFGGANVYEYRLAVRIDEALLACFGGLGSLTCHRNFPRPFFQTTLADGTSFKGVINDSVIKVSFPDGDAATSKNSFDNLLAEMLAKHIVTGERE